LLPYDDDQARKDVETIDAKVLSNRRPPYSLIGGLFDAMKDAGGEVLIATNEDAIEAEEMFERLEGIDLEKAAAIAVASLINVAREDAIDKSKIIMLNITGGGGKRFRKDHKIYTLEPSIVFPLNPEKDDVITKVEALFK
jgi:cysteate synthase